MTPVAEARHRAGLGTPGGQRRETLRSAVECRIRDSAAAPRRALCVTASNGRPVCKLSHI